MSEEKAEIWALRPLIRFHIYIDCTNTHDNIVYTTGSFISTVVITDITVGTVMRHSILGQMTLCTLALLQNSGSWLSWYWTYLLLRQFNFVKRKKIGFWDHFIVCNSVSVFETGDRFSPTLVWRHANWRTLQFITWALHIIINNNKHNNKVDGRICEVGATLFPPM
jgi:hypothetical protein